MPLLPPVAAPASQRFPSPAERWLDQLSLVPTQRLLSQGLAPADDPLVTTLHAQACALTWREALAHDPDCGPSGGSVTRQIIRAESQGWLVIHVRQPCPALRAADFLVRSGLLMHWQAQEVFEGLAADEACNMWRLSRDLVERRWIDGRHVGFLHRLGQLTHWQVGAIPTGVFRQPRPQSDGSVGRHPRATAPLRPLFDW
jgi:hypothetical protein